MQWEELRWIIRSDKQTLHGCLVLVYLLYMVPDWRKFCSTVQLAALGIWVNKDCDNGADGPVYEVLMQVLS